MARIPLALICGNKVVDVEVINNAIVDQDAPRVDDNVEKEDADDGDEEEEEEEVKEEALWEAMRRRKQRKTERHLLGAAVTKSE